MLFVLAVVTYPGLPLVVAVQTYGVPVEVAMVVMLAKLTPDVATKVTG